MDAAWARVGDAYHFYIEANAFLYRMVRSMVGSLKLVGDGSWSVEHFHDALLAADPARCGQVAPPQGLFLHSVTYQQDLFSWAG